MSSWWGRGRNVDSAVPMHFYEKLFFGSNFKIKYEDLSKTLIQPSNECNQNSLLSFQIESNLKKHENALSNFDLKTPQNVRKCLFLEQIS